MKVTKTQIPDLLILEPKVFSDDRGAFFESYNAAELAKYGITENFVQDNHVVSAAGILRGLHYQTPPKAQAKFIRVVKGSIFDVAVDLRKNSPTFGRWEGIVLTASERKIFYIPKGFAHGYLSLEDSEVLYKVSDFYTPELEGGIIWNDPSIGVKWPELKTSYLLSKRDQNFPKLKEIAPVVL